MACCFEIYLHIMYSQDVFKISRIFLFLCCLLFPLEFLSRTITVEFPKNSLQLTLPKHLCGLFFKAGGGSVAFLWGSMFSLGEAPRHCQDLSLTWLPGCMESFNPMSLNLEASGTPLAWKLMPFFVFLGLCEMQSLPTIKEGLICTQSPEN